MAHMDIWISLVCGSIVWGAVWSAGALIGRATGLAERDRTGRKKQ